MNKKIHLGFTTVAVLALVVFMTALSVSGYTTERDITRLSQRPQVLVGKNAGVVAGVAVEQAIVTVDRPDSNSISLMVSVGENMTALEMLQKLAAAYNLGLEVKTYETGALVNGIGGIMGGQDNNYWIYYVNGQSGQVAVDKQLINPGDKLEFKFEKSPF